MPLSAVGRRAHWQCPELDSESETVLPVTGRLWEDVITVLAPGRGAPRVSF